MDLNRKEGIMTPGKVVALMRNTEPARWDAVRSEKPAGWEVALVDSDDDEQKIAKELEDAQYLLALGGRVSTKVLETAKQLKLIQTWGMGTDHVPVKWCMENGIFVANAGGANSIAVAEYAVLLMLTCLKRFVLFNRSIREGRYQGTTDQAGSHELYDKTVGIIGFGNIGRRVAKLCYGFGANIVFFERFFVPYALRADLKARSVGLDELLSTSDIVTLHVPSFAANRKMIGWEELNKMKSSAHIINTSRGDIIDEDGLVRALNEKKIAGAGLDVFDPEPPDVKNPLLKMDNVVVSPHMAGLSEENMKPRCETIWRNVLLVSGGDKPLNIVSEF
jgi:glyoxylate/hydroxypyruvate/2-ketogluconate reductase